MKKAIYFFMICFTGLLFSCTEDDFQSVTNPSETEKSEREERFFLSRDYSVSGKGTVPTDVVSDEFIQKLKAINETSHFVCELSDQQGLPLWQYAYETANSEVQNKGATGEEDFIIIPMQEEEKSNLSSLLYIKHPNSDNPIVYTITNDELHTFVQDQSIEKYDRENVLMTFLFFDQQVFGEERKYTNIPLDLFENIPEAGIKNHEHNDNDSDEGFGYKEFSFAISEDGNTSGRMTSICVEYYHCPGPEVFPTCNPVCDGCSLCKNVICYNLGGSFSSGAIGGSSGSNTGGGGTGGGGTSGNNSSWYTYYSEYLSYHPKLRILLDDLHREDVHLDAGREVPYLNTFNNSQFFLQFISYLSNNTLNKSLFIRSVIEFLYQNRNEVVSPQNIMQRIEAVSNYLYDNPYAISDIPCDQISQWQDVAQHQVPQSVKNKLQNLDNAHTSPYYGWALQNIENAKGSKVNLDYYAVTFNTMPYKPFPHQNQQFTPEEFLYYVRTNLNLFVNTNYSSFIPSNQTGYNEGAIWF